AAESNSAKGKQFCCYNSVSGTANITLICETTGAAESNSAKGKQSCCYNLKTILLLHLCKWHGQTLHSYVRQQAQQRATLLKENNSTTGAAESNSAKGKQFCCYISVSGTGKHYTHMKTILLLQLCKWHGQTLHSYVRQQAQQRATPLKKTILLLHLWVFVGAAESNSAKGKQFCCYNSVSHGQTLHSYVRQQAQQRATLLKENNSVVTTL
ncbi:hypothetical protein J6590_105940, partial [Homalodisca vitripennis]